MRPLHFLSSTEYLQSPSIILREPPLCFFPYILPWFICAGCGAHAKVLRLPARSSASYMRANLTLNGTARVHFKEAITFMASALECMTTHSYAKSLMNRYSFSIVLTIFLQCQKKFLDKVISNIFIHKDETPAVEGGGGYT